jgi:nucleoside-diphosphate-sugar epimerase
MKMPRKRIILLIPVALFALVYIVAAVMLALRDDRIAVLDEPATAHRTIAIFGASGTAGDGILQAALASPEIHKIHVITRRTTPRIERGVAAGKVQMTLHQDYLDYSAIEDQIVAVDAVYWAIGISSLGVDEKTYGTIHVDYPASFVANWLSVSDKPAISFHYISSSDISEDSTAMWAREKVRAERTLFKLAEGTKLRVIAYRPDYIGPTDEEAHLGQTLLYAFFAPIGAAVKATQIGKAMIEVTARSDEITNGGKLGTRSIIRYADAYDRRQSSGHIP